VLMTSREPYTGGIWFVMAKVPAICVIGWPAVARPSLELIRPDWAAGR